MEYSQNVLSNELRIDPVSHSHLLETTKWAKFLSIVGFVLCALLVIVALFAASMISNTMPVGTEGATLGAGLVTFIYLVIAAINFMLCFYLYRFATKMRNALDNTDETSLIDALANQKSMFKLMGILTIIYLGLILLGIVVGIAGAAMTMQ